MTVVSGATWTGVIVTKDATGALTAPTVGPVGVLYVNGVANAAVVTIAGANPYTWTVTLPALVDGDCVSMYITATIALVATAGVVAEDVASTVYLSSRGTANAGDAMALTVGERTTLAMVIWNVLTTALTTVGSIGKYIVDKLALIGSGNVFVVSPVAQSGNVTVVKGASYLNVDGRRLEWTNTSWNVAVGSTIQVIVQDVASFAGTRLSATQIGLELTTAQTTTLDVGEKYLFTVQETKAGGEIIPRVQGKWKTTIQPTP